MQKIIFNDSKKCNKNFFKQFNDWIDISKNIYSTYRRKNDEQVWQKIINNQIFIFNNHNVVFYNFYLNHMFDVYINVEMCLMISIIKYIYKYIYKNENHTTTIIQKNFNKIEYYYAGRYLNFTFMKNFQSSMCFQFIWKMNKLFIFHQIFFFKN